MAIEFDCPHCRLHYRLKDELAGKTAACKGCRHKIVIPNPVRVPDDTPLPIPLDAEAAEAAALAALADDAAKTQEDAANRTIPVECQYCAHKWTEPIARAGKNTLCRNPECKQRIRIPEPKDEGQYDWRQTRTKGPSLAKQNQEKLEGVQDAAEVKQLSHETVKETLLEVEYEPRPLKQKVLFVLIGVGLLTSAVFGARYAMQSRTENKEDRLMQEAQGELARDVAADSYPKDELPLFTAVGHIAAGEHAVRHDTKEKLREALDQFAKAREVLRPGAAPARSAVCGELAVALLALGGTDAQVRDEVRIRWVPESGGKYRPNERVFTVFEELRTTLGLVQGADADFRAHLARRLTRELVARGLGAMALELLPLALFAPAELVEARALVALELYRADRNSSAARGAADELKGRPSDALAKAPSAQILFSALKTEKAPIFLSPPGPGGGAITEPVRFAYTGIAVLDGRPEDALRVAQRPSSSPDGQLRALTLCADWSADPGPALDAAFALLSASKDRKDVKLSPFSALRLVQIAAATGKYELAKQIALLIPDEGLRAWALGDAVRVRLLAAPKEKGEDAAVEVPDDSRKLRAGQAWGRMWIARQNTRISGNRAAEVKAVTAWPAPMVPFGKAGVALGLQDK
jgi:DNA-directed RNA polymerase subunit RPC12/RpoP